MHSMGKVSTPLSHDNDDYEEDAGVVPQVEHILTGEQYTI